MYDEANFDRLLKLYLENRCSPSELDELMDYLDDDRYNRLLLKRIDEKTEDFEAEHSPITTLQSAKMRQHLLDNIKGSAMPLRARWYWAAASVIVLVTAGMLLTFKQRSTNTPQAYTNKVSRLTGDIAPGSQKAILTLANGSTVALDTAQNGQLAIQGNTSLSKFNGKIAYNAAGNGNPDVMYNTIATPRGGQYLLVLADGTRAWLNAASSIHFPTAFAGKERRVQITGEVYFEVMKNQSKPFIVELKQASIKVLGTHFNVMAYDEEASMHTTLLEGAVQITNGAATNMLKPGQQYQLKKDGDFMLVDDVDLEEVMAWKNGSFHFENADLQTVLRQLSRWYDVEVIYRNSIKRELLHADIPRNTNLSDALKVLELASGEKFKIEDRTIIVDK